ncbi:MAG TPA: nucleoside triphosphate pyrophosphohydrolase [Candidatus Syntrophosphaera thermopropionivorans]|jgi:MazG family protein|nr:nucleoside triphosphate pyrophosphohydrolase [Candidatus Syntrophosphaera sp.]HNZ44516.1 nucleoside triphosphate pyrophosphohydrolase [Candidatus Syntrophosphaera thermopropionivorans]MBP9006623.1 nucleoside triphosphate pyrophosphohydrolase [Candidatus Syntrophosphaera sp.]HOH82900.1 nucleoside triphosphate pyrophosphohydrolase [Candidatus Syntrophosphaera thermopropionivorans]HOJ41620.1 nucleoside triphosphate pyrophosphohydrolase [Candidatus Syntrophosphaera thermopropionivorans]
MKEFQKLVDIIAQLRDPVSGCPWDIKQTPQSLIPNMVEELYEVVEAIEDGDNVALMEELGDLLLHIVMQAQLASESGAFNIIDVLNHINDKLVRRHPHVFGELELKDADTVKKNWERLKKAEKQERKSVLEGIPRALPALIYAQRMQEKAASVGFDWDDVPPILEKIDEETKELKSALETEDQTRIKEEVGDLLFTIVNLARKLHLDAESALKETARKFSKRFQYIEEQYRQNGENINEASLEELNSFWELSKKEE